MRLYRNTKAYATKPALKAGVQQWAQVLRVTPAQVRVMGMTRKWGSCSRKGRVTLSTRLLRKPVFFQNCVMVHELLHLRIPNHGKLFKSLMNLYVPGWGDI